MNNRSMQPLFGLIHNITAVIESSESGPDTGVTEETGLLMYPELPPARLLENQVDVWCAALPEGWDPRLADSCQRILTSEEADRYSRFVFEKDRHQFLLTRALVRDVLSRYVGVEPSALMFTRNKYGKPSLALPADCPITFSLSHTKGLSVCAVALDRPIGVDVENVHRSTHHEELADRFFAPSETAFLNGLRDDQKGSEFIRLWTLKEAFVKARGLGLSIPLNSFAVLSSPDQQARVSFPDGTHSNEADWRFLQIRLRGSFHIAIAVPMPERREIAVRLSTIVPLTGESTSISLEPNLLNEWAIDEV